VSGTYGLVVTDLATSCTSSYSASVTKNPNYNCLTGTNAPDIQAFDILPNPTSGSVVLRLQSPLKQSGSIRV